MDRRKPTRARALGSALAAIGIASLFALAGLPGALAALVIGAILWLPIFDHVPFLGEEIHLQDLIDQQMRRGMDLVTELSDPVRPTKLAGGGWEICGGGPPAQWWDKAQDFVDQATELLERRPSLLKDFESGYNSHLHEVRANPWPADIERRTTAEKMLALANAERSTPRTIVEASLGGLTEARRRFPA
jgi:hypothetical protein